MTSVMLTDQVFRVKGLAGRTNDPEITITAFYGDERPPQSCRADLAQCSCSVDGLGIIIGEDVLDVGKSFRGGITGFSLEISAKTCNIETLQLKYAVCNAADLMNRDFYPQYEKLICSDIRFTLDGDRFLIEMSGAPEAPEAGSRPESAEVPGYSLSDIIGNIKADIAIISCYPNSREREELEASLAALFERAQRENDPGSENAVKQLEAEVSEKEKLIAEYINSSSERFKGSGRHLLEKTAGRGR